MTTGKITALKEKKSHEFPWILQKKLKKSVPHGMFSMYNIEWCLRIKKRIKDQDWKTIKPFMSTCIQLQRQFWQSGISSSVCQQDSEPSDGKLPVKKHETIPFFYSRNKSMLPCQQSESSSVWNVEACWCWRTGTAPQWL